MKKIRSKLLLALTCSSCLLFSAMLPAQPSNDTLSISGPFEFTNLDPSQSGYIYTRMQIVETLVDVEADGTLKAGLATAWEISDDLLEWRFQLREQVLFHDGQLMDAASVANSLTRALEKHGPLSNAPIESIQTDADQVVIRLQQPYNLLPAVLANYANVILSPAAYLADGSVEQLLGTGPYQLSSFQPPHKLGVSRFDQYWGGKAAISHAEYLTGHRGESRVLQARSGQADIAFTLDPASLNMLNREQHVAVHSDLIPRTILLKINSGHPFLEPVEARQALSLALDRSGIARAVLRVPGSEANQLVPSSLGDWYLDDLPATTQDQQLALELLASLAWTPGPDGVLTRNDERFALTLITYADRPELTVVATAIQAQLAEIGIEVNVSITNSSAIPAGHQDGSLEMALIARNYGFIADPLGVMIADFGSEQGGDWGAMNWANAYVPTAIEQLKTETSAEIYRQTAQSIARQIAEELPLIPIAFYTQQTAVNQRVQNFRFDPFERSYFLSEMELSSK
ncbi:ABC transporter substrate-binding protein [Nitrincola sp. MINF-07-Sa-05]|uniref:ABC transporter substrate-binding protein n=1 Tax=Nitrincola salilacus TaxID=3400273 RepID=UPI003917B9DE